MTTEATTQKFAASDMNELLRNIKTEKPLKRLKFSYPYKKLLLENGEMIQRAILLEVVTVKLEQLSHQFLRYDTDSFRSGYKLPSSGDYLLLLFQKELTNGLFCTLRKAEPEKVAYYRHARGEVFQVVMEAK